MTFCQYNMTMCLKKNFGIIFIIMVFEFDSLKINNYNLTKKVWEK